jgi:hypothetical protein
MADIGPLRHRRPPNLVDASYRACNPQWLVFRWQRDKHRGYALRGCVPFNGDAFARTLCLFFNHYERVELTTMLESRKDSPVTGISSGHTPQPCGFLARGITSWPIAARG